MTLKASRSMLNPDGWDVGPSRVYCESTRITAIIATSVLPCNVSSCYRFADMELLTAPVGAQMRRFSLVFIAVGCTILCIRFKVTYFCPSAEIETACKK